MCLGGDLSWRSSLLPRLGCLVGHSPLASPVCPAGSILHTPASSGKRCPNPLPCRAVSFGMLVSQPPPHASCFPFGIQLLGANKSFCTTIQFFERSGFNPGFRYVSTTNIWAWPWFFSVYEQECSSRPYSLLLNNTICPPTLNLESMVSSTVRVNVYVCACACEHLCAHMCLRTNVFVSACIASLDVQVQCFAEELVSFFALLQPSIVLCNIQTWPGPMTLTFFTTVLPSSDTCLLCRLICLSLAGCCFIHEIPPPFQTSLNSEVPHWGPTRGPALEILENVLRWHDFWVDPPSWDAGLGAGRESPGGMPTHGVRHPVHTAHNVHLLVS